MFTFFTDKKQKWKDSINQSSALGREETRQWKLREKECEKVMEMREEQQVLPTVPIIGLAHWQRARS